MGLSEVPTLLHITPRVPSPIYQGLWSWPDEARQGEQDLGGGNRSGLPIAILVASASPAEVRLVGPVLQRRFLEAVPRRLIGDKAYDSDPLDREMASQGIEMIAPHRRNRTRPSTQDGRPLRRYRRRWKVERLMAWLQNFRRILVRWEYCLENYVGFVHLGCVCILLRRVRFRP